MEVRSGSGTGTLVPATNVVEVASLFRRGPLCHFLREVVRPGLARGFVDRAVVGRLVQGVCSAPVWPPLAWDGEASQVHAAYAAAVADCVWDVVTAPLVLKGDPELDRDRERAREREALDLLQLPKDALEVVDSPVWNHAGHVCGVMEVLGRLAVGLDSVGLGATVASCIQPGLVLRVLEVVEEVAGGGGGTETRTGTGAGAAAGAGAGAGVGAGPWGSGSGFGGSGGGGSGGGEGSGSVAARLLASLAQVLGVLVKLPSVRVTSSLLVRYDGAPSTLCRDLVLAALTGRASAALPEVASLADPPACAAVFRAGARILIDLEAMLGTLGPAGPAAPVAVPLDTEGEPLVAVPRPAGTLDNLLKLSEGLLGSLEAYSGTATGMGTVVSIGDSSGPLDGSTAAGVVPGAGGLHSPAFTVVTWPGEQCAPASATLLANCAFCDAMASLLITCCTNFGASADLARGAFGDAMLLSLLTSVLRLGRAAPDAPYLSLFVRVCALLEKGPREALAVAAPLLTALVTDGPLCRSVLAGHSWQARDPLDLVKALQAVDAAALAPAAGATPAPAALRPWVGQAAAGPGRVSLAQQFLSHVLSFWVDGAPGSAARCLGYVQHLVVGMKAAGVGRQGPLLQLLRAVATDCVGLLRAGPPLDSVAPELLGLVFALPPDDVEVLRARYGQVENAAAAFAHGGGGGGLGAPPDHPPFFSSIVDVGGDGEDIRMQSSLEHVRLLLEGLWHAGSGPGNASKVGR